MSKKVPGQPKPARRGTDMVFTTDPIIPMKVETLLGQINAQMAEINRNISHINESMHKKADKSELDKLESKVIDIQRNGSDTAKRVEANERELSAKVEKLQRDMASREAVDENSRRLGNIDRNTKFQWIGIGVALFIAAIQVITSFIGHAH